MDATGRTKTVEQEPFEDLLIAAYEKGAAAELPDGVDANPWGNQPTL